PVKSVAVGNDASRIAIDLVFATVRAKQQLEVATENSRTGLCYNVGRTYQTVFRHDTNRTLPHTHCVVSDVSTFCELVSRHIGNQSLWPSVLVDVRTFSYTSAK